MRLEDLITWLTSKGITVAEKREITSAKKTVYIFTAKLPEFPFGPNKWRWFPITVDQGQNEIPREEIEAMLRHFWFANLAVPH